jgi:hypothetical protein
MHVTPMTDAQLVKVFSLKFTCDVIAALHRDIRRAAVAPQDVAADLGKLRAFIDIVGGAFQNLTAGEQYLCDLALRRSIDIFRYAGQQDEAATLENRLRAHLAIAA